MKIHHILGILTALLIIGPTGSYAQKAQTQPPVAKKDQGLLKQIPGNGAGEVLSVTKTNSTANASRYTESVCKRRSGTAETASNRCREREWRRRSSICDGNKQ